MALKANLNDREQDKFEEVATETTHRTSSYTLDYPLKKRRDDISSLLYYVGESKDPDALDSDASWRIYRYSKSGSSTTESYALDGTFTGVWDDRASYFSPVTPVFLNEKSLYFDGVNDFINFGNINNFERTDIFSLSFWIRYDNPAVQQIAMGKASGTTGQGWAVMNLTGVLGRVTFALTSVNNTSEIQVNTTDVVHSTNTYAHIVITYNGSSLASGVKIYANGVDKALTVSKDNLTSSTQTTQNMVVGAASAGSNYFGGYIDELSVYNKVLSASDALRLYNSGSPTDLSAEDGIVNWWRMGDGDTYPVIVDHISTKNGAMTNMDSSNITSIIP